MSLEKFGGRKLWDHCLLSPHLEELESALTATMKTNERKSSHLIKYFKLKYFQTQTFVSLPGS